MLSRCVDDGSLLILSFIFLDPQMRETGIQRIMFPSIRGAPGTSHRHLLLAALTASHCVRTPLASEAGQPSWQQHCLSLRMSHIPVPSPLNAVATHPSHCDKQTEMQPRAAKCPGPQVQKLFSDPVGVIVLQWLFFCHLLNHTIIAMGLAYTHGQLQILKNLKVF